jgi:hypothetical protein
VSALGFGLGFLLKRLVIGKSPTVVRKIAGTALQVGLSSLLAKKSSANGAFNFLKRILTKKKKPGLLPD